MRSRSSPDKTVRESKAKYTSKCERRAHGRCHRTHDEQLERAKHGAHKHVAGVVPAHDDA